MTAAALGSRQAAILAHLEEHPGLTATDLARAPACPRRCTSSWAALEQLALVVGVPVWHPGQGRQVTHWHIAPPGTVPPPAPPPDPASSAAAASVTRRPSAPAVPAGTRRACRPAAVRQRLPGRRARAPT